jgi:hypothetical protein
LIGDINDDGDDIASGGGFAGDVDEDGENYEQGEPQGDDDTFKEEISPNEACYIDVDPIELNSLIPLNDSMAKLRSLTFKEKSKLINNKTYHVWDDNLHQKLKYYIDS